MLDAQIKSNIFTIFFRYAYSRRILLGLMFSVAADALLVWDEQFLPGLGVFLLAQLCFISAFGFKPFNFYAAVVTYAIMIGG